MYLQSAVTGRWYGPSGMMVDGNVELHWNEYDEMELILRFCKSERGAERRVKKYLRVLGGVGTFPGRVETRVLGEKMVKCYVVVVSSWEGPLPGKLIGEFDFAECPVGESNA